MRSKHFQAFLIVAACVVVACAEDKGLSEQQLQTLPEDAEAAAQDILSETLALHTAIHAIYARAKGELEANPFALLDALVREPWKGSTWGLWGAFDARNELSAWMGEADRKYDKLNVRAIVAFDLFAQLLPNTQSNTSVPRYESILDYSADAYWDMAALLTSTGSAELENAYYFAPMFNLIASARIIVLSTQDYSVEQLEEVYAQTIEINQRLIGTGVDNDLGTLSDSIASRYSGTASAREKNEADPVAYTIRRMLEEQQAALE